MCKGSAKAYRSALKFAEEASFEKSWSLGKNDVFEHLTNHQEHIAKSTNVLLFYMFFCIYAKLCRA